MGNILTVFYFSIFTICTISTATTKTIKFGNSKFDAICIDTKHNAILFGINDYSDKGYYKNKSFLWSMKVDSLGATNWKLPLNSMIANLREYENIIVAECFIGMEKGDRTYFIDSENGTIVDSLENKRCVIKSNSRKIIYYENYMISGGHFASNFDKNIYTRKIGRHSEKKISFDGLIYDLYSSNDTLIVLAVLKNSKGQLSKLSIDLKLGVLLMPPKTLGSVEFGSENIVKIFNDSTFIIDNNCFKETQKGIIKEEITSVPLPSISNHKLEFTFYQEGFIYFYSKDLNKYLITEYNEQFDSLSQISASLNKNVSLYSSFYLDKPKSITTGVVKNRNRDLYLEQIKK